VTRVSFREIARRHKSYETENSAVKFGVERKNKEAVRLLSPISSMSVTTVWTFYHKQHEMRFSPTNKTGKPDLQEKRYKVEKAE